jgi:hypothetical protein
MSGLVLTRGTHRRSLGIMQSVMDNVLPAIHDHKQFGQSIVNPS